MESFLKMEHIIMIELTTGAMVGMAIFRGGHFTRFVEGTAGLERHQDVVSTTSIVLVQIIIDE